MIYSTANLWGIGVWQQYKDLILEQMRRKIAVRAQGKADGSEVVEIIYVARDDKGTWRSSAEENATHVKVTLEVGMS